MNKVIVVGGGAAGLLAAVAAAEHGAQVTVLEKMFKPGKKLLITGKGRCNITNDCDLAGNNQKYSWKRTLFKQCSTSVY